MVVSIETPEAVRVVVDDALGREVRIVHDGPLRGGQRLAVDVGGLAPGAYVVTATAASRARATVGLTVVR